MDPTSPKTLGPGGGSPRDDLPRHVLDNLIEGCQVIGPDFRYLYANESVAAHGRTTRERLVGRSMTEAYPGIEDTTMFAVLRQSMEDRNPRQMENAFTFPDGSRGWFELRFEPVEEGLVILSMDITQRKIAEAALQRSNLALAALSRCNQTLVRAKDERRFMDDVCRVVVEIGGYRLAWIGMKDGDGTHSVRPAARAGVDDGYVDQAHVTWDETERGAGPVGCAIRTGQPVAARFIATDPELEPWREDALARGFASCLALPIRDNGEVLGALAIYAAEPDAFDEAECALLAEMALDLGYGITTLRSRVARSEVEARVVHLNAVLRGIRNVNQLITRERDPRALIRKACKLLVESRGFHTSCIVLCDGERILGSADAGVELKLQALRKMIADGDLPECVTRSLRQSDVVVHHDPTSTCEGCPVRQGYSWERDAAAVRLESEGKVFGALLVSMPPGMAADLEELDLLREVAGDVAFALRSIELQGERDEAAERLRETGEQLEAIVQASPVAIFSFDAAGRVVTWNNGAQRIFGWSAKETFGRPVPIIPKDRREEHEALKRRILAGESFSGLEVERLRKDGTLAWVSVSTAPLRDREGHPTGIMAVAVDIAQRRQAEREREMVVAFLRMVNDCTTTRELVERSVCFFREELDFEAVGIRLQDGDDFPYYEARGFPEEFVLLESSLCRRDEHGRVVRDGDLKPALDCMCGNVIRRRVDPQKPFFTPAGSFWSNSTTRLLASTTEKDRLVRTRNRCNGEGYESVGLFALRSGDRCLGLLQLNDRRPGRFTPESLALHERLAAHLAVSLAKTRADESLARSEARYRELVENIDEVVFSMDGEGRILYVSPAVERSYGYQADELIGHHFQEFVDPEDLPSLKASFERTLQGVVEPYEFRSHDKQGRVHHLRSASRLRIERGVPVGVNGIVIDLTELRQALEAQRLSAERWRATFDAISDVVCVVSNDHRFVEMNQAGCKALSKTREQILGQRCFELVHGTGSPIIACPCRVAGQSMSPATARHEQNDKTYDLLAWPIPGDDGRPNGFVHIVKDITPEVEANKEKKQLEEQLKLAQRLEAIGRLAGGVAHDFNNLLSVIISYAGLVADELRESDPIHADVVEIRNAGQRAAALTRQLLAFSRKQLLEPEVLSLNKVITGIESMLRRLLGEDIDIEVHLDEPLGSVMADPGQIEQVIMNLAVNARDAMPLGGKLTIGTANIELDEGYAEQHVAIEPGQFVMLSVADTGTGMDAQTKAQVFDPFFTTKEKGKGTGLGLSTVYGIVKQSGGNIWVYSELGRGTTFKVYLPRVDAPAVDVRRKLTTAMVTGSETVLIVEDEEAVRRLAERILRGAGYRVHAAASGADALVLCEKLGEAIDLLLTDVVMPQMSGRELAQRLGKARPGLTVLYMSGYTDDAIVHHGVLDPGTRFIGKPFAAAELTRKVREVLDEGKGTGA